MSARAGAARRRGRASCARWILAAARRAATKGRIEVRAIRAGTHVASAIRDTGEGPPATARARAFDPFSTTKTIGHGAGRGLVVARSVIVDEHGGELRFESEPGRGTTFFVSPPIAGPPTADLEHAA